MTMTPPPPIAIPFAVVVSSPHQSPRCMLTLVRVELYVLSTEVWS